MSATDAAAGIPSSAAAIIREMKRKAGLLPSPKARKGKGPLKPKGGKKKKSAVKTGGAKASAPLEGWKLY